ncbi:MAG: hypothetical protein ABSG10_14155, partial [Terracidiphilus sp.]
TRTLAAQPLHSTGTAIAAAKSIGAKRLKIERTALASRLIIFSPIGCDKIRHIQQVQMRPLL